PKAPPPPERVKREHTPVELQQLKQMLDAIPNGDRDYDNWWRIIAAIHSVDDGADGLALAMEWSARSSKHDPEFLENEVWAYLRSDREDGVGLGTLKREALQHGWEDLSVLDDFEPIADPPPDPSKVERFRRYTVPELLQRPAPRW